MLSNSDNPPDGFVNTGLIVLPTTLTRAFTLKTDMPLARMWQATTALGGKIYAIGGGPGGTSIDSNSVINQVFDPAANSWVVKYPMPTARCAATAVAYGNTVFVFGGTSGSTYMRVNEAYNTDGDGWLQFPAMTYAAAGAAGVNYNNEVIILLGGDGTGNTSKMQVYNPNAQTWYPTDTPVPQFSGGGSVLVGTRIYILGGNTRGFNPGAQSSVYGYYDVQNNSWTAIPAPSSVGFYFSGAALLNGKIYMMGGVNYNGSSWSSVYVLDINTNTWTSSTIELAIAAAGLSSAAVGNAMYVIGGGTNLGGPALKSTQSSEANLFYLLRKL